MCYVLQEDPLTDTQVKLRDDKVKEINAIVARDLAAAGYQLLDSGPKINEVRLSKDDETKNHNKHYRDIDSDLELQESSDIVIDVSSPHDGPNARFEVIVSKNQRTRNFGS